MWTRCSSVCSSDYLVLIRRRWCTGEIYLYKTILTEHLQHGLIKAADYSSSGIWRKRLHGGCKRWNLGIAVVSVSADCVLSIALQKLNWQLCKGPRSKMGITFGCRGVGQMSVDKSDALLCLFTGTGQQTDEVVQSSSGPHPNVSRVRIQLN